jgi:hypothetical protein
LLPIDWEYNNNDQLSLACDIYNFPSINITYDFKRILLIPIAGDDVVHSRRCVDTKEDCNKAQEDHHVLESLL